MITHAVRPEPGYWGKCIVCGVSRRVSMGIEAPPRASCAYLALNLDGIWVHPETLAASRWFEDHPCTPK